MRTRAAEHLWPSGEQRLLLDAAFAPDERAGAAFAEWASRVDLSADFGIGSLRLLPLVYSNALRLGITHPLMGRLKGVYRKSWYENQRLVYQLRPVIGLLTAHGIDVLLLKGAPLALGYYDNLALRPMADVDIAVRPPQLRATIEALRRGGWKSARNEAAFRFQHAIAFYRTDGLPLDLHANVICEAPFEEASESFWATSEPLVVGEVRALQPDPTGLLLHIVIHGLRRNRETPVRWIPDAITVLQRRGDEIDWDRLVAFARRWRITGRLSLGFEYLARELEVPIPAVARRALAAVRPTLVERIENTVILAPPSRFDGSALGNQWVIFAEYLRTQAAARPSTFVRGFSHYLRHRWQVSSRREIPAVIYRGLRRRLARLTNGTLAPMSPERSA